MGGVEGGLAVGDDGVDVAVVDLGWGQQREAPVVVGEVVPVEEAVAVGDRVVEAVEAGGEVGPVLEGLEAGFGVGGLSLETRGRLWLRVMPRSA